MSLVEVDCYAGYKGEERPIRLTLGGRTLDVIEIEDQWYSPDAMYFRVRASDANVYVLRHDEIEDRWTIEGFRSGT